MIFNEKTISLKDGRTAVLRSPRPGEGQAMIDYGTKACGETEFLMRCPEECADITVESEEKWIADAIASPDKLIITCFIDGKPVGNCDIRFNTRIKACHRSTIGIGILKEYWNLGIGSAMMAELVAAATERGVRFVELGFVEGNARARHLYEKFGFRIVSLMPDALRFKDGGYRNEYFMRKEI